MEAVINESTQKSSTFKITPEKTAITNGVSYSAKRLVEEFDGKGVVLDYGAGKLRNSRYMNEQGMTVDVADTPEQIATYEETFMRQTYSIQDDITERYDAILCSFVLNVIPDLHIRMGVLRHMKTLLNDGGFIYLETRADNKIASAKTATTYGDGYLLGSGEIKTFQKKIDLDELRDYANKSGLKIVDGKRLSASAFVKLTKEGN